MSSIFSKIIAGEIPGRFVWKDEKCVAFYGHYACLARAPAGGASRGD